MKLINDKYKVLKLMKVNKRFKKSKRVITYKYDENGLCVEEIGFDINKKKIIRKKRKQL